MIMIGFSTVFSQLLPDLWKLQNKLVNSFQYLKICLFSPFWGSLFCLSILPFSMLISKSFHCFQDDSGNLRPPTRGRQHAGIALIHYLCLFMFGWLWLYRKVLQWLLFFKKAEIRIHLYFITIKNIYISTHFPPRKNMTKSFKYIYRWIPHFPTQCF